MINLKKLALVSLSAFYVATSAQAEIPISRQGQQQQQAIYSHMALHHPVWAKEGMVASQEALATQIGVDILAKGGNAIDAAVAVGYALAVTLPRAGNLGGGGFMMIYLADEKRMVALDYREMAR